MILLADATARPISALKGVQKAAAIMLTLSEDEGARVLEFMDEREIRLLSAAMADMGTVSVQAMGAVASDFDSAVASYSSISGSFERTESLLGKALPPEQVKLIMDELRHTSRGIWKKLSGVDRGVLSTFLRGEHPQTIALVLSQIESELSARILATFPQALAMTVINRMLTLQPVSPDVLQQLEESIEAALFSTLSPRKKPDPHAAMAEVFNLFDRTTETRLMGALEERDPNSSRRIRELMFTFDDMTRLDAAGIQTIIRAADKATLAKAMQGASELISSVFLSNMSIRAAKAFSDDIAAMQDLARSDVEAAQGAMIKLAKALMDRGEIARPKSRPDDGADDLA